MNFLIINLILSFLLSYTPLFSIKIDDVSRLNETEVSAIVQPTTTQEIQKIVKWAHQNDKKISVAGQRHSQGGHICYPDAVVLDMLRFNKILKLDQEHAVITVQAGATWKDIQEYSNPYHLAVKNMQSFNSFTVGGSLSVNVHGQDIEGPLISSIVNFRMVNASGELIEVNRMNNEALFRLVIGGYGLFGIVTDIDLQLTPNLLYRQEIKNFSLKNYINYFNNHLKINPLTELHFARFNVCPKSAHFLNMVTSVTYQKVTDQIEDFPHLIPLHTEKYSWMLTYALSLIRNFSLAKKIKFPLEGSLMRNNGFITRNNAMYNDVHFLDYDNEKNTDILQEYFIPVDQLEEFVAFVRSLCIEKNSNILNITIRYVPRNEESILSYAQHDSFALVFYINHELTSLACATMKEWTQKLIDKAIALQGSYYLPYQLYASKNQLQKAYPLSDYFFECKKVYDPQELFINHFYMRYK